MGEWVDSVGSGEMCLPGAPAKLVSSDEIPHTSGVLFLISLKKNTPSHPHRINIGGQCPSSDCQPFKLVRSSVCVYVCGERVGGGGLGFGFNGMSW